MLEKSAEKQEVEVDYNDRNKKGRFPVTNKSDPRAQI